MDTLGKILGSAGRVNYIYAICVFTKMIPDFVILNSGIFGVYYDLCFFDCCSRFLFFRHTTRKGKRFVRVVNFLKLLDGGATAEEANNVSSELFTKSLSAEDEERIIHRALQVQDMHFNGKQTPAIKFAMTKGFNG